MLKEPRSLHPLIHQYMKPHLLDSMIRIAIYVLLFFRHSELLKRQKISSGGTSATIANQKIIFKKELDHLANSIFLIHNHPSCNQNPSDVDRNLSAKLKIAKKYLDIPILDHIIFTEAGYFSFVDEGFL